DHAHVFVSVGGGECMIHLLNHQARLRIFVTRTVGYDFGDGAVLLVQYCLIFHRCSPTAHFPLKFGLRFSTKARGPSFASSEEKTPRAISFSILKPSSSGRPDARATPSLIARTARGPL